MEKSTIPTSFWPHGITYQIFIQSFADGNGDGIGDLKGLEAKLPYLADLGIEAIWLLPVHPSPSYHKYDVTDYRAIHPDYGTMEDFRSMLTSAHALGIRVLIDMVINHSSDRHPWFQESLKSNDNLFREYYVWSDDTVLMAKDEPWHWHEVNEAWNGDKTNYDQEKYYGFFWKGMPDLNMDHTPVREEVKDIAEFWLNDIGIDGFRLDAVKFVYPQDQVKKNHSWWQEYLSRLRMHNPQAHLVGEIWDEPEFIAPFLKGIPSAFNFHMSWALVATANKGRDTLGIINRFQQIHKLYRENNPNFIDATFLTNHDQNRLRSDLKGSINKCKVAANLLFTLPGAPYIYYGEEIGMLGMKPDEYIREPFLWDYPGKDSLQTSWEEPKYSFPDSVAPLSVQQNDSSSLFFHYKKLIQIRRETPALVLGDYTPFDSGLEEVLGFYRIYENEKYLIIHNLGSRRQKIRLPESVKEVYFKSRKGHKIKGDELELSTYSVIIFSMK